MQRGQLITAPVILSIFIIACFSPIVGNATADVSEIEILHTLENPSNGHTYHLLSAASWEDSAQAAIGLGGFLVTVNDEAENNWIFDNFGSFDNQTRHIWTGLNDADEEGVSDGIMESLSSTEIGVRTSQVNQVQRILCTSLELTWAASSQIHGMI